MGITDAEAANGKTGMKLIHNGAVVPPPSSCFAPSLIVRISDSGERASEESERDRHRDEERKTAEERTRE